MADHPISPTLTEDPPSDGVELSRIIRAWEIVSQDNPDPGALAWARAILAQAGCG